MPKPFSVNVTRFDPYKSYRFLVYFGTSHRARRRRQQGQLRSSARPT